MIIMMKQQVRHAW